ncbi:hypothetical protein RN001_003978 [Aquatica leii]|uniref:Cyclin-dependent kinase inhibitor domain-containing protein n=1 Tax=Aquatica leii TaxID=1421715 RepID=A0AAN7QA17_9COLE|nr:hypothetical protein RN001_003978 [Aquatica leii]
MANNGSTENRNRTRVRRRLFQDDVNDEVTCTPILQQEFKCSIAEAREKWNFDFENETPLEGNWIWTKVSNENNNNEMEDNHNATIAGTTEIDDGDHNAT